jgi:hypothetical protein
VSEASRSLYEALAGEGLLEYGSFIPGDLVRRHLDLEMPQVGTRKQFLDISLDELSAVDRVREMLLNEGKYLAGSGDGYRILTPGENRGQVDRYLAHAQNKISRARKLERTSPAMSGGRPNQTQARLDAIERGIRKDPHWKRWKDKGPPEPDTEDL